VLDRWALHFWDYSIGSIAPGKFNRVLLKYLKENIYYLDCGVSRMCLISYKTVTNGGCKKKCKEHS
jgi:hypothetical protein